MYLVLVKIYRQDGDTIRSQVFPRYTAYVARLTDGPSAVPMALPLPGELSAYPNPAGDVLHIDLSETSTQVQLRTILGKLVYSGEHVLRAEIPVSHLPSGVYLLSAGELRKQVVIAR